MKTISMVVYDQKIYSAVSIILKEIWMLIINTCSWYLYSIPARCSLNNAIITSVCQFIWLGWLCPINGHNLPRISSGHWYIRKGFTVNLLNLLSAAGIFTVLGIKLLEGRLLLHKGVWVAKILDLTLFAGYRAIKTSNFYSVRVMAKGLKR